MITIMTHIGLHTTFKYSRTLTALIGGVKSPYKVRKELINNNFSFK